MTREEMMTDADSDRIFNDLADYMVDSGFGFPEMDHQLPVKAIIGFGFEQYCNGLAARDKEIAAVLDAVEARELLCQRCSKEHPVWFTPNRLWNHVTREGEHFLCPTCFITLAEERGYVPQEGWRVDAASALQGAEREEGWRPNNNG